MNRLSTLFALALVTAVSVRQASCLKCYSCFAACKAPDDAECDCSDGDACETSQHCFTRISAFSDAKYGVHKGCIEDVESDSHRQRTTTHHHCFIDGHDRSAECLCGTQDYCNTKAMLTSGVARTLNATSCCMSEEIEDEDDEDSSISTDNKQQCTRHCRGSYCYDDHSLQDKGCGHGSSELLKLLRFGQLLPPADKVCARFWYGEKNVLQHGCVCASGDCNKGDEVEHRQHHSKDSKVVCKMCIEQGTVGVDDNVNTCNQNQTCLGDFCYVQYKSEQFSQFYDDDSSTLLAPEREFIHSIQHGCVSTDASRQLVRVGCTREFGSYMDSVDEFDSKDVSDDDDDDEAQRHRRVVEAVGVGQSVTTKVNRLTFLVCLCDKPMCNTNELVFGPPSVERLRQLLSGASALSECRLYSSVAIVISVLLYCLLN